MVFFQMTLKWGWGCLVLGMVTATLPIRTDGAPAPPVMFQTAPGQFEIAALDVLSAQPVVTRATEAWRLLTGPLGLPAAFSTSILVRLVPASEWPEIGPFRVIVESGGLVSVRIRWSDTLPEDHLRRALVQGLLMRLAVARHGVTPNLTAPLWLEQACVQWWRTRAEPAQADAMRLESVTLAPVSLDALLIWQRGEAETRSKIVSAFWLLTWLQAEAGGGGWRQCLSQLLAGAAPRPALEASFPPALADADRELGWQTGYHHHRRVRTLPLWEADESQLEIAALARFVFVRGGVDAVVPLATVLAHAEQPEVAAELQRRAMEVNRLIPALHPFYRNAGLSLSEALANGPTAKDRGAKASAAFAQEWSDANELRAASKAALDAWEAGLR